MGLLKHDGMHILNNRNVQFQCTETTTTTTEHTGVGTSQLDNILFFALPTISDLQ